MSRMLNFPLKKDHHDDLSRAGVVLCQYHCTVKTVMKILATVGLVLHSDCRGYSEGTIHLLFGICNLAVAVLLEKEMIRDSLQRSRLN